MTFVLWQMMPLQSVKIALSGCLLYEVGCGVNPTILSTPAVLLPLASSSLVLCSLPRVHLFFIYFSSYASIYLRGYQDNYICSFDLQLTWKESF